MKSIITIYCLVLCVIFSVIDHTKADENKMAFTEPAFSHYKSTGVSWAKGAKLVRVGLLPDGVFEEKNGGSSLQLDQGTSTFISGLMPIEFAGWIATGGDTNVVVSDGSRRFYDLFKHALWVHSGSSETGIGQLEIVGVKVTSENQTIEKSWSDVSKNGKPVVIGPGDGLQFRIRLSFTEKELDRIFAGKDTAKLSMALGIDIGKIKGNEGLAHKLESRRGRPHELYFPTMYFTLVKESVLNENKSLITAMATWKFRKAKGNNSERWKWLERIIEVNPDSEIYLLGYANELERGGETDKAVAVAKRLIELIKKRPNTTHSVWTVAPFSFSSATPGVRVVWDAERVIKALESNIKRLEKVNN